MILNFEKVNCDLAEGINVSQDIIAWVDITRKTIWIYERHVEFIRKFHYQFFVTKILGFGADSLIVLSQVGIVEISVVSGLVQKLLVEFELPQGFRTNDGCMIGNMVVFGVMSVDFAERVQGCLGVANLSSGDIAWSESKIYIPNLFVSLDRERVLIADSHRQRVDIYRLSESGRLHLDGLWYHPSGHGVPDGGYNDENGEILLCIWDGSRVDVLDPLGKKISEIAVGVSRPTSICRLTVDELIITFACEPGKRSGGVLVSEYAR